MLLVVGGYEGDCCNCGRGGTVRVLLVTVIVVVVVVAERSGSVTDVDGVGG